MDTNFFSPNTDENASSNNITHTCYIFGPRGCLKCRNCLFSFGDASAIFKWKYEHFFFFVNLTYDYVITLPVQYLRFQHRLTLRCQTPLKYIWETSIGKNTSAHCTIRCLQYDTWEHYYQWRKWLRNEQYRTEANMGTI